MDWWKNLIQKLNKPEVQPSPKQAEAPHGPKQTDAVSALKKRVRMQALTALASIALIMVLVFAMTAAWYTNVAKTGDLTFEAEAWGYDADKIHIGDVAIPVAPGSSGASSGMVKT